MNILFLFCLLCETAVFARTPPQVLDEHDRIKAAQVFSGKFKSKAEKIEIYYNDIYLPRRLSVEPSRKAAREHMLQLSTEFRGGMILVQQDRIKLPKSFEGTVLGLVLLANMQEQRLLEISETYLTQNLFSNTRRLRLAREWEIIRFMPQDYLNQELITLPNSLALEADRKLARSILTSPRSTCEEYVNYQIAHGRGRIPKRMILTSCGFLLWGGLAMYNWLM